MEVPRIEKNSAHSERGEETPELLPEERPEEYLSRITHTLMGGQFSLRHYGSGMNIQREVGNQEGITAAVQKLMKDDSSKKKFSEEKNKMTLEVIESLIKPALVNVNHSESLPYADTIQKRNFFGKANPLGQRTPISHTLFCLGLENEITEDYLEQKLNGKTIYLLGGGDSVTDLITSKNINPRIIVNVDPYIGSESIEKSGRPYLSLNHRIEETSDLMDEIEENKLPLADEIWATYSVPYYLESPEQIEGMFSTIIALLAEGGTARIAPLFIQSKIQGGYDNAKRFLLEEIRKFLDSPDFNVYVVNNEAPTLFIERLAPITVNDEQP